MATETLYALFQTVGDAERAIGALMDHGIDSKNIGVIARQPAEQDEAHRVRAGFVRDTDQPDVAFDTPITSYTPRASTPEPVAFDDTTLPTSSIDTEDNVETVGKQGLTTTTAADAGVGAAIGSGIGLIGGILATAAALTIPGFGLVLAGGAFLAGIGTTLAATAAGAVAGGAVGYLRDMGIDDTAASTYAERLSQGDYLLSVTADTSDYDDVRRILYKYNAVSVDQTIEQAEQPVAAAVVPQGSLPYGTTAEAVAATSDYPIETYPELQYDAPGTMLDGSTTRLPVAGIEPSPIAHLGSPEPVRRIITEDLDGAPIIPAREIEEVPPSAWRDPAVDAARAEAAIDHDAEVEGAVRPVNS